MADDLWTRDVVTRACPLCGSSTHRPVATRMQHGLDLTTVMCTGCTFVFTNPVPRRETYERFYAEAYARVYKRIARPPDRRPGSKAPQHVRQKLDRIQAVRSLANARLLEIGAGQGSFLRWASEAGCTVLGVEPSPEFCGTLAESGLPFVHGSLAEISAERFGRFDVAVMLHVLEHFWDPNDALRACRELLVEDGVLVLEVPNILKPFRSLDRYFLRYPHPSSFSPDTLGALLEKHGFTVLFSDDEGPSWEPQNLFVIARRALSVPAEASLKVASPADVLAGLDRYRAHWRFFGGPVWYAHLYFAKARRPFYRLASGIRRRFAQR